MALDHPNQMPETVRAFVAVSVDDAVENAVAALVDELRAGRNDGGIRWVRRGNLHLTLKFLGPAVPAGKLEPLKPMLERIAAETAPFELSVRGVGGFPSLERPRVIWVGLEGEGLGQLARRVEEAAVRCGFEAEKRAFTGHLTIGRVGSYRGFDTIRRALTQVDPDALSRAAAAYLESTFPNRRPLALDGKTRKNSASSTEAQRHLLGVIRHGTMSLVAQADVGEKENEIPVAQHVLKTIPLEGTIVTADALHTQVETARQTVEQGGEYLLTVKANQPSLYQWREWGGAHAHA